MLTINLIVTTNVARADGENHAVERNPHMGVFESSGVESIDVPTSPGGVVRLARAALVSRSLTLLGDFPPPVREVSLTCLPSAAHYPAPLGNWGCRARVELEFWGFLSPVRDLRGSAGALIGLGWAVYARLLFSLRRTGSQAM